MKASEYLTRPELGLTKAQVECVTKLASICGIDSMFEGIKLGGVSKAIEQPKTATSTTNKSIFGDEEESEDDGVEALDTLLSKSNYSGVSQSDDDITSSIDDPSTVIPDQDAFANQAGEDAEAAENAAQTDRLVEELVCTIANIYGHDQVMDLLSEYLENADKANQYVDSYIENMSNNLRSTTGDDIAKRLTGSDDTTASEVTIQKLKRLLQIYKERKFKGDDSSVSRAIDDIVSAIEFGVEAFDANAMKGYGQGDANEQVMKSLLGAPAGRTIGRSSDLLSRLKRDAIRKAMERRRAATV
jgi:hypothetical protein